MDYYSITDPEGTDGWVGLVGHSGHLTHEVVTCQL